MDTEDLKNMPGHLIRRLHQRSTSVFQERVRSAPVALTSVQYAALEALAHAPGIDQAQLAALISYDRATIGDVIKRLVERDLLAREVKDTDRRARVLRLTDQGRTALATLAPVVAELQAEILAPLSEEERAQFIALSQKALGLTGA